MRGWWNPHRRTVGASMKALPKRKGNGCAGGGGGCRLERLNESPSEKEGKFHGSTSTMSIVKRLNESPSEKEGK